MENKMRKDIDRVKNFGRFINENTEINETFYVDEIISYDYEYTAKVVNVHDGGGLLDVILYHPKAGIVTKLTSVASSLCVKFKQT